MNNYIIVEDTNNGYFIVMLDNIDIGIFNTREEAQTFIDNQST